MAVPFLEFEGNRRLLWIAEEWQRYADRLAEWAMERLVNRRDVWSQYTLKNGEISVVMLPIKERRQLGTDMVTLNKLERHFAGRSRFAPDRAALDQRPFDVQSGSRSTSIFTTRACTNADEIAEANFAAAMEWAKRLREQRNGPDLDGQQRRRRLSHAGCCSIRNIRSRTFTILPTTCGPIGKSSACRESPRYFRQSAKSAQDDLPYTLATSGTASHAAIITRGSGISTRSARTNGSKAAKRSRRCSRPDPAPLPKVKRKKKAAAPRSAKSAELKRKPRVCLDLDGVLAKYERWRGFDHIGPPLPGRLRVCMVAGGVCRYRYLHFAMFAGRGGKSESCRTGPDEDQDHRVARKIQFPYTDVYIGQGKPRAAAFIDDRAVSCSPQTDKDAFKKALASTRSVVSGRTRASKTAAI